ncbi:MAG: hypothetical protein GTO63_20055 [Anaerolineae bacterium]|nr:hypothetical protein [Anaerolineae bacterium]NIN97074.1 hypothetical protein [Anaerolineae bacterium]NIQ80023.1 hypothetical protein [Anaerolineae bacterium]
MSENVSDSQAQVTGDQSASWAPRKPLRRQHLLVVIGMLAFYVLGLYSHPLLFRASADAATGDSSARTKQSTSDELASGPELQHLPVAEAYEVLARELSNLSNGSDSMPQVEARLAALEEEVRQLRVLNPYYMFKEIQAEAIPTGVPAIYGAELNVSFDQVQASIDVMAEFGPTYGKEGIALTGPNLERYVRVASATACKYCCTATTLVKPDGSAACGCDHSQAMRGLAAYLIANHQDEYTDDELVEELNRWRAVYFPRQTLTEELVARQNAGEPGIEEIMTEFPEFMPQMVGGC